MSFLTPLFLLGGLAVALPVVFHLIRRTTKRETIFSSLMFLQPTPPRLTRRSRLEHLFLLALRCLALCLLAVGFSRPFIKKPVSSVPPANAAKRIVVLVDTSASMRRANLWSDARARVESVLRQTSPADQVAIYTFDRQIHPLVTFQQWNATAAGSRVALATQRLGDSSPGWLSTHLGNALINAAEMLADTDGKAATGPRRIVLVSDLQEGSRLDQLQGYEWPKGVELSVESLKARYPSNAGLQLVTDAEDAGDKSAGGVRVRVSNAANSHREQFTVGWARADGGGFAGAPVAAYVPPGQSRIVAVPAPASAAGVDRIVLRGDDDDFDNTVFVTPPAVEHVNVIYLGNDPSGDSREPLYFLQRAFQDIGRRDVRVIAQAPSAPLNASEAKSVPLFVVTGSLPAENADALRNQITAGKTVLFVLKNTTEASTLAWLCGANDLTIEEARPANYAMLGEIDFRHPLFAPFADPRFSDFTKIHFWKYRRVDASAFPGARVVAKFDNGDPALLDVPVGKGRVLVLTSGWQPEDSQFALSSKFVPFLYAMLDYSGAAPPPPVQYHAGDVVSLAAVIARDESATIRTPAGAEIQLTADETNFSDTTTPGIYTILSKQRSARFAVNLDGAESRTAPLPVDELERLGAPITRATPTATQQAAREMRVQNADLENRQKLWRWFIVATLVALLFETWLAGRTARRLTAKAETAT